MKPFGKTSFERLAEHLLGTGFPRHLAGAVSLPELRPDARAVLLRVLDLMKRSGYAVTQFNPVLMRWLSVTIPGILPGAWEGQIPPITAPGRHRKLDDYVAGHPFPVRGGSPVFVDVGCGFPPVTTADTARRLPGWQVYGLDRSFAHYVLYDKDGDYACFNRAGVFRYFQPSMGAAGRSLYTDPGQTKKRFTRLFKNLFPLLENREPRASETVEKKGNRLIRNHIRDFETDTLKFIQSDLTDLRPMNARVFRCMNVFIYFTRDIRTRMLGHITGHLEDGGLVIAGTNSFGIQARYAVHRKEKRDLTLQEFAFSLDNLGHISTMPWFTIHDNDPEALLLADLAAAIRSAPSFWPRFSRVLDHSLACHGICRREPDGFLHFPEAVMAPSRFLEKNALVWREMQEKGYAEAAADVLGKAGYEAWINPAADIAVRPPAGSFS